MRWVALLLAASLCRPTPADFQDKWVGRAEDDVVLTFGRPTDVLPLSSGNRVLTYHVEFYQESASGPTAYTPADYMAGVRVCDRRFEIEPSTKTVVRVLIHGNGCDYSQ